jgi:TRAP-type uncharacterized transport system fused permease subunit
VIAPAATQYHRGIYVVITYILVFLVYRSKHPVARVGDFLLIALSVATLGYWILNFEAINYRAGAETEIDKWIAIAGVLVGVEVARRVVGMVFVVMGGVMLAYGVFGEYAPELISHAGDTFPDLAQRFFIDFPLAAVGHKIGGPGKVSVIASGLFGSISGSAIANTVSTGAFTIPMMKKAGFEKHVAGGIEPAASLGGMFMPPIMGAGGFIMAELTGLPYSHIMLVAVFPALMYFFSVFMMVHYYAKRNNIVGEKSESSASEILKKEWFYILPLVVITIFMLMGFSPGYSAILGIVSCIAVSWFRKETRVDVRGFVSASRAGAEASLKIGATVGVIGIIIGVLTYSGLVLTFADIVIELADGKPWAFRSPRPT